MVFENHGGYEKNACKLVKTPFFIVKKYMVRQVKGQIKYDIVIKFERFVNFYVTKPSRDDSALKYKEQLIQTSSEGEKTRMI